MTNRIRSRSGVKAAAVAALACSLALVGCAPPSDGDGVAGAMSLTVGMVGSSGDTLNPYQQQGSNSSGAVFDQVFERLVTRDADGALTLVLAESIEPNETGDEWTITLRDDVKLHTGEQFAAEDVVESLRWMIDPANAWAFASQLDFISSPDQIREVDDLTVVLDLDEPFGLVPEMLAFERAYMRSIRGGATVEEPAGTGPFTVDSFTAGQEARFSRFDDYWGEAPKISSLKFAFFTEQNAVTNAIRGGQIDVARGIPFPEVPALESDPNLELVVSDTAAYPIVAMNLQQPPFDQLEVRQAVRYAVDRDLIVSNAFGGFASVANDFIGMNTACPAPDVPQREQDLELAKQLLAEAGAQGAEVELVTDGAFPGMMEMAALIIEDLNEIGLKASVQQLEVGAFLDRWTEWPFFISFTSSPYEVTAKAHFMPGGSENATWFDDEEYNRLAGELYRTTDPDAQCEIITQLQTIEYERGPYLVPVFGNDITVHRSNVSGLEPDLYGRTAFRLTNVTVE
ncbi:ABC transporter substrate-binding protein [Agromyces larvae]|uniref:ABC transporter substrate-binding protein n=1 Tax=Agromyces larvae TaxID=2929802 RepID=A0ABY4C048_9MICO|nr:ABC transporter substrate-binding protein [Agromyces larvae]UOE44384.1 ABC transporter substrate-binding protein [Agromyces larvae]